MGCCNPEGLKHLGGTTVAKWQAATGGSLFFTGLGLELGLLGQKITRFNIVSLPFKEVDIKIGLEHKHIQQNSCQFITALVLAELLI